MRHVLGFVVIFALNEAGSLFGVSGASPRTPALAEGYTPLPHLVPGELVQEYGLFRFRTRPVSTLNPIPEQVPQEYPLI
jgi:hypothetical protein